MTTVDVVIREIVQVGEGDGPYGRPIPSSPGAGRHARCGTSSRATLFPGRRDVQFAKGCDWNGERNARRGFGRGFWRGS